MRGAVHDAHPALAQQILDRVLIDARDRGPDVLRIEHLPGDLADTNVERARAARIPLE